MRLFLAYTFDDALLAKLKKIIDIIKIEFDQQISREKNINIKYVDISDIHLTIKFFENQNPDLIINALKKYNFNFNREEYLFNLSGLDAFPNRKEPKVLILKIHNNQNIIEKNQKDIEKILEKIGINKENRRFIPHLTLARIKNFSYFNFNNFNLWETLPGFEVQKLDFSLGKLKLFQSILTPTKPIYKEIYEF